MSGLGLKVVPTWNYQTLDCHGQAQVMALQPPASLPLPIVIPSYKGARKQANLTPLLALALARLGFPVVVHGVTEDPGRVTSAAIFRELGDHGVTSRDEAQAALLQALRLLLDPALNALPPLKACRTAARPPLPPVGLNPVWTVIGLCPRPSVCSSAVV